MDGSLTSFIEEVCGDSHLRVENDLGDGFVRLRSAEAERRQAKHDIRCTEDIVIELLRNARDAHARNIFLSLGREGAKRRICVLDDGEGIPEPMHERVFEPRVTSKLDSMHVDAWGVHGRGMALFSIASNAETARVAASDRGQGTSLVVVSDLDSLPEKTDQSSLPAFSFDEEGQVEVRGPHNINRVVSEFAYEHRDRCTVYCGSATEIAATLYGFGCTTVPKAMRAARGGAEGLPVCKRLCLANDPTELEVLAGSIGLTISNRSARRILDGDIAPIPSVAETIAPTGGPERPAASTARRAVPEDERGLRIAKEDLEGFSKEVQAAFDDLAERYYLATPVKPEISLSHGSLHVRIPLSKLR